MPPGTTIPSSRVSASHNSDAASATARRPVRPPPRRPAPSARNSRERNKQASCSVSVTEPPNEGAPKLSLCRVPVSLSLTAVPSTDVLGPPRGRPDRAAAAWPCLAGRSVIRADAISEPAAGAPPAPPSRLPVFPRRITATRQARPRAGRSGRPRGGPRLRRGIAVSEINRPLAQRRLRGLRTKVPPNSVCAGCLFLCRSRQFQVLTHLGLRGGALTGRRPLGLASLVARLSWAHANSRLAAGTPRDLTPVCSCLRVA